MTEPKVTVGVPVFNSGPMLRECLQNLLDQTFEDYQVLIFDNCSTDETPDIAQEFVRLDSRFRHIRQSENKGSGQNFLDALNAADTEYFLWRADDDRTSEDFLAKMVSLLDSNPGADLAVCRVESCEIEKKTTRNFTYPNMFPNFRLLHILELMFRSHASWFYGLWRTDVIKERYANIWSKYKQGIAYDHLVLLGFILKEAVVGDQTATFYQFRNIRSNDSNREPTIKRSSSQTKFEILQEKLITKLRNRAIFRKLCRIELAECTNSSIYKSFLGLFINQYADKRSLSSIRKITQLRLQIFVTTIKNIF